MKNFSKKNWPPKIDWFFFEKWRGFYDSENNRNRNPNRNRNGSNRNRNKQECLEPESIPEPE